MADSHKNNELWHMVLTGQISEINQKRRFYKVFRDNPRCRLCESPFSGLGGQVARTVFGQVPSKINPHFCNRCYDFLSANPGGAEVEMTLLFADIRGSTSLAEQMGNAEFSRLINRFYITAAEVFGETNAWMERLVGDQVIGLYLPLMAGPQHARVALRAARELLKAVGYGTAEGAWLSLGIGVHTGMTFMGTIGSDNGMQDVTVLGDAANTTARLSSVAASGEVLVSDAACAHAAFDSSDCEARTLQLKGRAEPISVHVATLETLAALVH